MKLLLVTLVLALSVEAILGSHYEAKAKLWKHLFDDYHKEFEPEDAKIGFGMGIQCAMYDRRTHVVSTYVWERYSWVDKRLTWAPADYDNVQSLRVSPDHLWMPDFKLYHGHDEKEMTKTVLNHDGSIIWIPPAMYKSLCEKGANDTLHCHYKIGSWTVDDDTVGLEKWGAGASLDYYQNTTCPLVPSLGHVEVIRRTYPCCHNIPYAAMEIAVDYVYHDDHDDDHHHHHHHHDHDHDHDHHAAVAKPAHDDHEDEC
ncbi:hypothetical protein HELRODRAFT_185468 [Helobdella robusta]|uniref:Neurotransmitter-gated ion-channel ligand-binding domain-containing protein n=1 Tax=Helobdella robusta TaxID=6412 RepID=T1FMU9_HELRO|nr:hypothetical protein HELRODRAFT_185468 [Helobdella robusta]ESO07334.1 hypothetical protein HELRODRAFT_185468 [Helobdella robusta]